MAKTSLLVLAAGLGSRYGGVKQVDPVGPAGEATLEYSLYDALRSGFDEIVFLIRSSIENDLRRAVLNRLPTSMRCRLAFQELESLLEPEDLAAARASGRTKPWGTAHALLCAASELRAPFAVVNADDFYGRESFRLVHDFLAAQDPAGRGWCMAGFELAKTASPHGAVSRGICVLRPRSGAKPGSELVSVTEHPSIIASAAAGTTRRSDTDDPGTFISRLPDGSEIELDGRSIVSMNLWGLTPAIFPLALPLFRAFMAENRGSTKAEFYLPALIDALVARGEARVEVLPTPETWFGLTYREDAAAARARIAELGAAGEYPAPLWGMESR
jgi:hypothetical protein